MNGIAVVAPVFRVGFSRAIVYPMPIDADAVAAVCCDFELCTVDTSKIKFFVKFIALIVAVWIGVGCPNPFSRCEVHSGIVVGVYCNDFTVGSQMKSLVWAG